MIFRSMGLFEFSGECELYRSGVDEFVGRDVIDTVVVDFDLFISIPSSSADAREYLVISLRSTLL